MDERKAHVGELVQLDGRFHVWYETRAPRGCLMNLVDDATGRTLARLGDEETIWAAADVLCRWIEAYGVKTAQGWRFKKRQTFPDPAAAPAAAAPASAPQPKFVTETARRRESLGNPLTTPRSLHDIRRSIQDGWGW